MLTDISEVEVRSSDRRYLYDIRSAVISGECSLELDNHYSGKMTHTRRLKKANRILRLYFSTNKPSIQLK